MDKYKHFIKQRGEAVGVSNKAIDQLKRVQHKIDLERRSCEEAIAKMEMSIENARRDIEEKKTSISFLQEEATRAEKTMERLNELIVTQ